MALIHEFENRGNWLFKRRGWLPVFFLVPTALYLWLSPELEINYSPTKDLVFLSVGMLGQIIRALTVGRTPKGTSGRNIKGQIAKQLNTSGIYSTVRHPLYLGNYFMWIGPVLLLHSVWFFLVFSLIYWIYYERIMFAEEQFLRKKFGESYDQWSEKVGPFIPSFRNFKSSDLPFSFRNVLKREYHGFANMFIVFALVDLGRNYFISGEVFLNPIWFWAIISAMLIWLILRILVKTTSFLNVKGR